MKPRILSIENTQTRYHGVITQEVIIGDYGSSDGLQEWVESLPAEQRAMIRYVRTDEPKYFHMAKAKNFAHRAATGDILCNLDADNVLGPGFVECLINVFQEEPDSVFRLSVGSGMGRIAILRHHFMELGGYDESFEGWGGEDDEFFYRACAERHLTPHLCDREEFRRNIEHSDEERMANYDPALGKDKWATLEANRKRMRYTSPDWIRGMLVPRGLHMVVLEGETEAGWRGNWESWLEWHPGWDARVWTEVEARTAVGNPPEGLSAERRRAWLANALLFEHGGVMVHPRVEALGPVEPAVRDVSSAVLPGAGDVLFHVTAAYRKHSLFWDIGRQPALLQRRVLVPAFRRFAARHHWRDLAETREADRPWRITKASRSQRSPA